ncbi:MAG: hypothetical protein IT365_00210 [Candidatus Hydrogenedentes bacterium]|nr:hypothetical protein [Candidatus Hydrogenedentota bacterium]
MLGMRSALRSSKVRLVLLAAAPLLCGAIIPECGNGSIGPELKARDFVQINKNGFGYIENLIDMNDYPWGLVYFQPDGADEGHVYVSTGNGIDDQLLYELGESDYLFPPLRPGEIRRYRPDIGPRVWYSVLDIRQYEVGPVYSTTGFRSLHEYRPAGKNQPKYLYAGSASETPSLWRSLTGDRGSWEVVWSESRKGSIRAMAEHNGILYFNFIPGGEIGDGSPGEIWAHDGTDVWSVVSDGFGNPNNTGVWALGVFNGYLYASTANLETGFEVWKLEGPDGAPPVCVVDNGGPSPSNEAAATCVVYKDKIYFGTQVFGGFNLATGNLFKGAQIIRLDADDNMEVVVGPNSISGFEAGFGRGMNAYIWSMTEFNGELYVGTWDQASIYQYLVDYFPDSMSQLMSFLLLASDYNNANGAAIGGVKRSPTPLSAALEAGGDLYRSPDGDAFYRIFDDGLGDPYNYGARNMLAVGKDLYIGMANIYEGLEVWRASLSDEEAAASAQ